MSPWPVQSSWFSLPFLIVVCFSPIEGSLVDFYFNISGSAQRDGFPISLIIYLPTVNTYYATLVEVVVSPVEVEDCILFAKVFHALHILCAIFVNETKLQVFLPLFWSLKRTVITFSERDFK